MSTIPVGSSGCRPLVVVAEDGPGERTMLGLMLEVKGFDTVLTADGRAALDAVLIHGPDAVVSDMNMPHLDGLGLCRALRALRPAADLPVILWSSADPDDPRLVEAIALGGVEFVSKSAAISRLDTLLRRLLGLAGVGIAS